MRGARSRWSSKKRSWRGCAVPLRARPRNGLHFHKAVGCNRCGGSGYRGRIGVYELMVTTDEVKDMILRRMLVNEIGRVATEEGMVRLREDGLLKAAGTTTIEEVLTGPWYSAAGFPKNLGWNIKEL